MLPQFPCVWVHFHLFAMLCHKGVAGCVQMRERERDTSPNAARLFGIYRWTYIPSGHRDGGIARRIPALSDGSPVPKIHRPRA